MSSGTWTRYCVADVGSKSRYRDDGYGSRHDVIACCVQGRPVWSVWTFGRGATPAGETEGVSAGAVAATTTGDITVTAITIATFDQIPPTTTLAEGNHVDGQ